MERKKASDYPQELLDLFHEYQHGDIDRRAFLERAGKFAVGGLTAATILSEMKPNYAWAQQVPKDDARIKTEVVTVPSPQGNGSIKGLFAKPAKMSGKLPGMIVEEGLHHLLRFGRDPVAVDPPVQQNNLLWDA